MLTILVYTFHVLICFFLIAVVLLQQGKGADLSVFGGGGTQTAFGARGAATVLHKMTVGSFVAFIITTLSIGALQDDTTSSVIDDLPEATATQTPGGDDADAEAEEEAVDEAGALPTTTGSETEAAAGEATEGGDGGAEPPAEAPAEGNAPAGNSTEGEGAGSDDQPGS